MMLRFVLALIIGLTSVSVQAEALKVAVAANFKTVLDVLAQRFSEQAAENDSTKVLVSSASSGQIYNQILNGAPYDVFLSADSARPEMLERKGKVVPGSRRSYAYGRLALWDKTGKITSLEALKNWKEKLVIANPKTAPYGLAAKETLENAGLWRLFQTKLIQGNSIQQAWFFIDSGNASVGLVAWSQLVDQSDKKGISLVPNSFHNPIRQELVILNSSKNKTLAKWFSDFLMSPASQQYIVSHGYESAAPEKLKRREG